MELGSSAATPARSPRRVLVPIDGTPLPERFLATLAALLGGDEAEIALLAVVDGEPLDGGGGGDGLAWPKLEGHTGRIERMRRTGEPAEQIVLVAAEWAPSFIALATSGRSGLDRWLRGSVADAVLRRAPCPVLAANPATLAGHAPRAWRFDNILVPLDGTARAAAVLPIVTELARTTGASVTLLHSIGTPDLPVTLAGVGASFVPPATADALLDPFRGALALAGVAVRTRAAVGEPADAILAAAAHERSDLIALTTHGRSGLARLLLGSVAADVVARSSCPVLVQRTDGPSLGRVAVGSAAARSA